MNPKNKLLSFEYFDVGIQKGILDLNLLYSDAHDRTSFEKKWPEFFASDSTHLDIFKREEDDLIVYRTESLIPIQTDGRPPVLMLFGNPASRSVYSGMFFSFEGAHKEHRFWIALRNTGFLEFRSNASGLQLRWDERNRIRKEEFINLEYQSPFRIGLEVFFSIPSASSHPQWSGVSGLQRLFGREAMHRIAAAEEQRIENIIEKFNYHGGGVITFQRDAYEGVRASDTPAYKLSTALSGALLGKYKHDPRIRLLGAPPTRTLHSQKARDVLVQFKTRLLEGPDLV